MCRGAGEGGRRCPGRHDTKALEAHNRRRRENRAIKAGVISWAKKQSDVDAGEIGRLQAEGPKQVKDWAEAKGLDPRQFLDSDPANIAAAAPAPVVPPTAAPARPTRAGNLGGGPVAGGARGGGMSPRPIPGPAPVPAAGAPWTKASWAKSGLREQVEHILATQGDHRDERALMAGASSGARRARGGTNETQRIEFDNGVVGYHKPFSGLHGRLPRLFGQKSAQQPVHEVAAWQLAKRMGRPYEDIVPPCILKEVNGELGSLALERPGRINVSAFEDSPEWRDAAFFDALIGQQDRHHGNWMRAGDRIALIDHGYAFARDGDLLNWSQIQGKRAGDPLTRQEYAVLDELIASPDLFGLRGVLEPDRAVALLKRAMRMKREGTVPAPGTY